MTQIQTTDTLRGDYEAMKRDLNESMQLCRKAFDQQNRVMFTITELLYGAVECVQQKKPFRPSPLLHATFEMIDKCTPSKQIHEVTLLKFARTFSLFLESINGYAMYEKQREVNVMLEHHKMSNHLFLQQQSLNKRKANAMSANAAVPFVRPRTVGEEKARLRMAAQEANIDCPRLDREDSPDIVLPSKRSKQSRQFLAQGPPPLERSDEIFLHAKKILNRSVPVEVEAEEPKEERVIKEEETDEVQWEANHTDSRKANKEKKEIKEEVKEEPIEEPVSDIVSFGDGPPARQDCITLKTTSSNYILDPYSGVPSTSRPVSTKKTSSPQCPFCFYSFPPKKLEHHVRSNHRNDWLKFVKKCPEEDCDFRAVRHEDIREHQLKMHDTSSSGWKSNACFTFVGTPHCPYCTQKIKTFAQFINHMEVYHPRMVSYEVDIMKCATCPFTTYRCYEMFAHWLETFPACTKGLTFKYDTAHSLANLDEKTEKEEKKHAKMKKI